MWIRPFVLRLIIVLMPLPHASSRAQIVPPPMPLVAR